MFGVKSSLITDLKKISDIKISDAFCITQHGLKPGDWILSRDFVLATNEQNSQLRVKAAEEALRRLGSKAKLVDGLPVADDLD